MGGCINAGQAPLQRRPVDALWLPNQAPQINPAEPLSYE